MDTSNNNPVTISYIGCGCNKSTQILDWNDSNLICFGVCNAVAIYDPSLGRIVTTLTGGHSSKVNVVKWIRSFNPDRIELVSGSSDSSIVVWHLSSQKNVLSLNNNLTCNIIGHKGSVHALDGKYRNDNTETVIASASSDGTVRLWLRQGESESFVCISVIDLNASIAFCVDLLTIPDVKSCLLAFGTDSPELVFYSVGDFEETVKHLVKVQGHEDWIRSLAMKYLNTGEILVASSAQDNVVRILRLSMENKDAGSDSFCLKKDELFLDDIKYYLSLETVLFGHEGWIYSVEWLPTNEDDEIALLSASFDRTVVVWKPCPNTGVWIEDSRMGELGGDNSIGYYGAKFSPDGLSVVAHSYQGSFHRWQKQDGTWNADFVVGGHSDAVMDITWGCKGEYLLSVSSDKTTRLYTLSSLKGSYSEKIWCEISRPQIHGHAMSSIASLKDLCFASSSEEKVIRVFEAPDIVLKLLSSQTDSDFFKSMKSDLKPSGAAITALGLSNKAVFESELVNSASGIISDVSSGDNLNEDFLVQNTLWPEAMKLYGHGNDVFSVAASNDGKILATAAKATNAEQAKIILWDTETWKIINKLEGHQLTITQMAFSPTDLYLLSVSRDRKWCLFKKNENDIFELFRVSDKKGSHTRIIWSCDWSHDEKYFVTGSRDFKVIVWENGEPVNSMVSEKGSVTAVTFGPVLISDQKYLIVLGHESGDITLYSWCLEGWYTINSILSNFAHHLAVQRLRFRPITDSEKNGKQTVLQLASCSLDHSVRIYNIEKI